MWEFRKLLRELDEDFRDVSRRFRWVSGGFCEVPKGFRGFQELWKGFSCDLRELLGVAEIFEGTIEAFQEISGVFKKTSLRTI